MAEQLFHIGIKALIVNDEGSILLFSIEKPDGTIKWDMPGGRMDEDETFLQTLNRELLEEIGCSFVNDPEYFDTTLATVKVPISGQEAGLVLITYRIEISDDAEIILSDSTTGYKWATPKDAADLLSTKYPTEFTERISQL